MRALLDKNIVRAAIAGLRFGAQRLLLPVELSALLFWRAAETANPPLELFIPYPSAHILARLSSIAEVRLLLDSTQPLYPGPYTRRWQRRVRETTGLTPEDAMILARGVFGTDAQRTLLGVHAIVTADQRMLNGYRHETTQLQQRLWRMTVQLNPSFDQAVLPRVLSPEEALTQLSA